MNKRFLLGAIPVISIMLLATVGTAFAANGGGKNIVKVPLTVYNRPTNYPFDKGWVVFGGGKGEVSVHVIIKGVLPNHAYTVYLEIDYHLPGWVLPILGTLTTNESGNGEFKGAYTLPSGTYLLGIDVADKTPNPWTAQFVSDADESGNWSGDSDMWNTVIVDIGAGFDEFGYNYQARIFNGLADGVDRNLDGLYSGSTTYANDHLVMKWSKAWDDARFGPDGIRDSGDELPWTPDAWVNNEWNGMVPGGSGEVWHYKIIWTGLPWTNANPNWRDGGYGIWGEFEVIMDQGTAGGQHFWGTHAKPTGYGA
ncbi:hypothetical protein ES703_07846 [subsurface metagenome]